MSSGPRPLALVQPAAAAGRIAVLRSHLTAGKFDDNVDIGNDLLVAQMFDTLQGKVAVVTGGSIGIGRMIAEMLAVNGVKVYISSRKAGACEQTARELTTLAAKLARPERSPGVVLPVPADLSSPDGCIALAEAVAQREERVHILVNNAGATWGGEFDEYDDKAWDRCMHLNVRAVFKLTQQLAPQLEAAGVDGDPARVITISSIAAKLPPKEDGPTSAYAYNASKAAVNHLCVGLAKVLAARGITSNVICPGLFKTKMNSHLASSQEVWDMAAGVNPLKRNGLPHDLAGTVCFLCSRAGSYVNGAQIPVDGGFSI